MKYLISLLFALMPLPVLACAIGSSTLATDPAIVNYWTFDGNANDSIGTQNGTATNITWDATNKKFGESASFNGTSSKITTPNAFVMANQYTLHFWFRPDVVADDFVYSKSDSGAGNIVTAYEFGNPATRNNIYGYDSAGSSVSYNPDPSGLVANTWYMIDVVWNTSTGKYEIYKDGVIWLNANGSLLAPRQTSNYLYFGSYNTGGYYGGEIDDFAYFSRPLSSSTIASIYANNTTTPSSVCYITPPAPPSGGGSTTTVAVGSASIDTFLADYPNFKTWIIATPLFMGILAGLYISIRGMIKSLKRL